MSEYREALERFLSAFDSIGLAGWQWDKVKESYLAAKALLARGEPTVSKLESLKRYRLVFDDLQQYDDGEMVYFSDVQKMLARREPEPYQMSASEEKSFTKVLRKKVIEPAAAEKAREPEHTLAEETIAKVRDLAGGIGDFAAPGGEYGRGMKDATKIIRSRIDYLLADHDAKEKT